MDPFSSLEVNLEATALVISQIWKYFQNLLAVTLWFPLIGLLGLTPWICILLLLSFQAHISSLVRSRLFSFDRAFVSSLFFKVIITKPGFSTQWHLIPSRNCPIFPVQLIIVRISSFYRLFNCSLIHRCLCSPCWTQLSIGRWNIKYSLEIFAAYWNVLRHCRSFTSIRALHWSASNLDLWRINPWCRSCSRQLCHDRSRISQAYMDFRTHGKSYHFVFLSRSFW